MYLIRKLLIDEFLTVWRIVSVMNNYQAAQAGFPPASPHGAGHGGPQNRSFPAANSPGPIDMYSSSAAAAAAAAAADSAVASYVQAAASPQPPTTAFPAIAVSRAPLNYSPVSSLFIIQEQTVQCSVLNMLHTIIFRNTAPTHTRIYVEHRYTLLQGKYQACGSWIFVKLAGLSFFDPKF